LKAAESKKKKRLFSGMVIPTIVMGVIAALLLIIGYQQGSGEHTDGLKAGVEILLQIIPLLIFAFIVAGMVQILLPTRLISRWVGTESGFRGILIGTIIGSVMPGGPFVSMPIAAALLRAGAGIGTMVAFMVGWSLLSVSRLPLEVGIMGGQFVAIRLICVFFMPIVAGLIANTFFGKVTLFGGQAEHKEETS
jgi:uncharacterized membrane protein YraQ (UPF0718 family)